MWVYYHFRKNDASFPAGKGLTSWLSFVVSSVSLSLSHWYPGSGVVLDCIDSDLCTITYFYYQSCFVCAAWRP